MIEGIITKLVEIKEDDAYSIISLRNVPEISKFLSGTKPILIEEQVNWIKANFKKNDGYYFKICDQKDRFFGTISIYNVVNKKAEFGRYICTNPIHAIEAELLLLKLGFDKMELDEIYCRTVFDNKKVWNQHYKFGFKDIGFENFNEKNFILKVQELNEKDFHNFDYSDIEKLILKFT